MSGLIRAYRVNAAIETNPKWHAVVLTAVLPSRMRPSESDFKSP